MDWQGQKLAEQLMQTMLLAFALLALLTGYIFGSFEIVLLIYAGGVVLTSLITVPDWPIYNRHPVKWLDPSEAEKHPKPQPPAATTTTTIKRKASKKYIDRFN